MSDLLIPAQVAPPATMRGGGGMQPSQLAMAMMNRGGSPVMQNPMGGIPLGTMAMLMHQNGGDSLGNGLSNLFNGYNWNGTPGSSMMSGLQQQAAGNIAGGAAGL